MVCWKSSKRLVVIIFFKKRKVIVTHGGSFHADDLFACATLKILYPCAKIIRAKRGESLPKGDIVLDIGGIYDPQRNLYDHHQKEGAGFHEGSTIPYASFGLIWKHFGMQVCKGNKGVWERIEKKIVLPTDAVDNGIAPNKNLEEGVSSYFGDQVFLVFSPTWEEGEEDIDKVFLEQVENAKRVIEREIYVAFADTKGEEMINSSYQNTKDKRVIELKENFPRYLYQDFLCQFEEPLYVIYPSADKKTWNAEGIRKSLGTLESRLPFPQDWRGSLDDASLANITGVTDAVFCHRSGFLASAKSKEGAMKLVELSLKQI